MWAFCVVRTSNAAGLYLFIWVHEITALEKVIYSASLLRLGLVSAPIGEPFLAAFLTTGGWGTAVNRQMDRCTRIAGISIADKVMPCETTW